MPRIVLSLAEWQTVARELAAAHTITAPPGLLERVQALLKQAPDGWPDQNFALELDEESAVTVRAAHDSVTGEAPGEGQRAASVAEAIEIVHDHQHRK